MKLSEVIFIDDFPSVDLHGFDRDSARVKVLEFINDNLKMKKENIVIIHGIGLGSIKDEVHKTLARHKKVLDYKIFYYNDGATIVQLDIDK